MDAEIHANSQHELTAIEYKGRRYYDPILCLLLWAVALEGEPARECLHALGVDEVEMDAMFSGYEPELAEMRRLRMVSELYDRQRLGDLMRARLAELLMMAQKGTELGALIRAAERMPLWVFGEEPPAESAKPNSRQCASAQQQCPDETYESPIFNCALGELPPEVLDENGELDVEAAIAGVRQGLAELERLDEAEKQLKSFYNMDLSALEVPPHDG